MTDVLCIGIAGADVLIRGMDADKGAGETTHADSVKLAVGGDAANEAVILARLGRSVRLMSGIGRDDAGLYIRNYLRKGGVDTSLLQEMNACPSAMNVVIVDRDGERRFINTGLPATGWTPALDQIGGYRAVSLASFFLPPFIDGAVCLATARAAKESGAIVFADMVHTPATALSVISDALAYVDYLFPNEEEAAALVGETDRVRILDRLLGCGVGCVVMKGTDKNCYIRSRGGNMTVVPAYHVDGVVDTTGAGDNFAAGFICALLEGKTEEQACRFAHGVAAVSVQREGATTGVVSRQAVDTAIRAMQSGE